MNVFEELLDGVQLLPSFENIESNIYGIIAVFTIFQLINVMSSIVKTVLTVKGKPQVAAIANAISYGISAVAVVLINSASTSIGLLIVVGITILTNYIGTMIPLIFMKKIEKDVIYKVSTTVRNENCDDFIAAIEEIGLSYLPFQVELQGYKVIDIFSKNKKDSIRLKTVIKKYNVKYNILALENKL